MTWCGWVPIQTSMDYHLPLDQVACDKCGGLGEGTLINSGARPATIPREGWATLIRDIFATRCPHCGHDRVWDSVADEYWDLDETDYSDAGSCDPESDGQGALF